MIDVHAWINGPPLERLQHRKSDAGVETGSVESFTRLEIKPQRTVEHNGGWGEPE